MPGFVAQVSCGQAGCGACVVTAELPAATVPQGQAAVRSVNSVHRCDDLLEKS